jgi:CubicO group peptidase (beta-lactamase class C family)
MSIQRREFLKSTAIGVAGLSLAPMFGESLFAAPKAYSFKKSTPEQQGISSASILDFITKAEAGKIGLHSLMVIRNGNVVAEGWWDPYKPNLNHTLNSLSKSFTSTGIGFAVSEGLISVEDKVTKFFPDDLPANPSPYLNDMRIKHLLTMTTGNEADTSGPMRRDNQVWTKGFLSCPVQRQPGTYFLYNSGATYMLSAIITKVSGKSLFDYLTPRLFKPLGISGIDWETSPQGINTGGWGLRIKTEDIAKLGMLYLQNGIWNGKQVLPASWAKEATAYKVPNSPMKGQDTSTSDWQQGYCYQFWRCRHDFFRGDGAQGQYCLVSRDLNTVIAITSEVQDMQKTLNYVWDYLLPGIKPAALPADTANQNALKQKLATLTLLPAKTNLGQSTQAQVSGKTFNILDNPLTVSQASLTFKGDECSFVLKGIETEQKITCGLNKWIKGETPTVGVSTKNGAARKIVASGRWTTDKTFVISLQYYETPNGDLVICNFENNTLTIKFLTSITANNGGTRDNRTVLEGTV